MALVLELLELVLKDLEVLELAEVDLVVEHGLQERLQHRLVDGLGARMLGDRIRGALAERIVRQIVDRRAHHREARRQQALLGQVVQRGQQLFAGEVSGAAEDDHDRGVRDAIVVQPLGKRIPLRHGAGGGAQTRAFSPLASVTTAWPPNWLRIIASMRSPNVFSMRLRNRANSDSAMIGTGTDSSIAASTVQRPSPVSSTQPLMPASSGSCDRPRAMRSSSHERTTLPVRQASAIACMFMPGKTFDIFITWKPSA